MQGMTRLQICNASTSSPSYSQHRPTALYAPGTPCSAPSQTRKLLQLQPWLRLLLSLVSWCFPSPHRPRHAAHGAVSPSRGARLRGRLRQHGLQPLPHPRGIGRRRGRSGGPCRRDRPRLLPGRHGPRRRPHGHRQAAARLAGGDARWAGGDDQVQEDKVGGGRRVHELCAGADPHGGCARRLVLHFLGRQLRAQDACSQDDRRWHHRRNRDYEKEREDPAEPRDAGHRRHRAPLVHPCKEPGVTQSHDSERDREQPDTQARRHHCLQHVPGDRVRGTGPPTPTGAGHFWAEDDTCVPWLDAQAPGSVVYVAFGSLAVFDAERLQELADGLVLTGRPFLWVFRPNFANGVHEGDGWLDAFRRRVAGNGLIVGWAPQQRVLSHPSVACFVSHCGWNSTMEGVRHGVPFLCWPYFADQFLNQSYICDLWGAGLRIRADERGIVTKEEIRDKVALLLGDEEIKARALSLKSAACASIADGGSLHKDLLKLVNLLRED